MNEEDRAILERIAIALEKIADKPVVITNALVTVVWDEVSKTWVSPDTYEASRA